MCRIKKLKQATSLKSCDFILKWWLTFVPVVWYKSSTWRQSPIRIIPVTLSNCSFYTLKIRSLTVEDIAAHWYLSQVNRSLFINAFPAWHFAGFAETDNLILIDPPQLFRCSHCCATAGAWCCACAAECVQFAQCRTQRELPSTCAYICDMLGIFVKP